MTQAKSCRNNLHVFKVIIGLFINYSIYLSTQMLINVFHESLLAINNACTEQVKQINICTITHRSLQNNYIFNGQVTNSIISKEQSWSLFGFLNILPSFKLRKQCYLYILQSRKPLLSFHFMICKAIQHILKTLKFCSHIPVIFKIIIKTFMLKNNILKILVIPASIFQMQTGHTIMDTDRHLCQKVP